MLSTIRYFKCAAVLDLMPAEVAENGLRKEREARHLGAVIDDFVANMRDKALIVNLSNIPHLDGWFYQDFVFIAHMIINQLRQPLRIVGVSKDMERKLHGRLRDKFVVFTSEEEVISSVENPP